ncbi:MAG: ABC transporter substrate-binding protein [Thermodesulfobacteriota bacterium]
MKPLFSILLLIGGLAVSALPAEAEPPRRIVSLGPVITEMIYLLGAEDSLIADTVYCNVPEAAREKTKIGNIIQVDVEKIISLAPDIVLANPLDSAKQLDTLRKMGIRVVQFDNPATFDKICAMMDELGRLLGREDQARAVIAEAKAAVDTVVSRTRRLPPRKVFIQIGMNPLHTSPEGTFIHEYITFSGGINVAAHEKSGNYSREKVLETNPDVILISGMGTDTAGAEQEKRTWLNYSSLNAARTGEVHVIDSEILCSPTPVSFADALAYVAALIHPPHPGELP